MTAVPQEYRLAMGRPRTRGGTDLPAGLYYEPGRGYRARNPLTAAKVRLGHDREAALEQYRALQLTWVDAELLQRAEELADRLRRAAARSRDTVADYCRHFRAARLPHLRGQDGDLLSPKTRADYDRMLRRQVEPAPLFNAPFDCLTAPHLRAFLAAWIDSPAHYRYMVSLLSRIWREAIREGKATSNPVAEVDRPAAPKRRVYVPDDVYAAVTARMSEWQARACDLLYLLSSRPGDALSLRDCAIEGDVITYRAAKTGVLVELTDRAGDLITLVGWFQERKREQGGVSPHLVTYPREGFRPRDVGRPVSVGYLSRAWCDAAEAAGYERGRWKLKDLRKKGLTDEARLVGAATRKGGHLTDGMARYYVTDALPVRADNRLRRL